MTDQPVELSDYSYTDDNGNEVTLRLTRAEAEERGLTGTGAKAAQAPANKSKTPNTK